MRAEMALVNAEVRGEVEDDLPAPSTFNHAIVLAHLADKNIWIDPTISYQGGTGTNIYCPDYGKALLLIPGSDSLRSIPDMPGGEIKYTEDYNIENIQKPVSLIITTTYSSYAADDARRSFANESKTDLEKNYLDYYSKIYGHIESADTLVINDDKDANTLVTVERYTIADFLEFDSANQNYATSFYASMIKNKLPVVGKKKEYPISVSYPYSIHYAINVNAPFTWQIPHKSGQISRNAYYFSYDISTYLDHRLSITYEFNYLKDHIAPAEISQYEKDRKKITDDHLSYSFTYTPGGKNTHPGLNFWAVLSSIVLFGGCTYIGVRIYKTKTERSMYSFQQPRALGGWLILPIIGLIFSVCRVTYFLFDTDFFSNAVWHAYDAYTSSFQFKVLLGIEFAYNSITICFALFCLVLLFQRRDILPKYFKVLLLFSLVGVTIDSLYAHMLSPVLFDIDYKSIGRSFVAACIWIPYFSRSVRVRDTFIVTYPKLRYWDQQIVPVVTDETTDTTQQERSEHSDHTGEQL